MIYHRKIDVCLGTRVDFPKPKKWPRPMRETTADRPNWRAPLPVTLGMIRSDGISCVLTEVKLCLKAKSLEIDYHEGNAHIPHVIALNRNWKKK